MTTLHITARTVRPAATAQAAPGAATQDTHNAATPPAPAAKDQVRATTPKADRPAVDASLFAVVVSPDRAHTFSDIRPDVLRPIDSWRELPAVLQDLKSRSQTSGQVVVLDLAVHGNNGTGLKVVHGSASGDVASITSVAEINRMVKAAGFAPGQIVIMTEGCNVHRSWAISADGFTPTEKTGALRQADRLATSHGTKLAGTPEIVDHGPTKVNKDYLWLGRGPGTNWISTVFLQYVTGNEDGAPLQDLRQYKDPKAPLETQTDAVMQVAGMRGEMIDALKHTRFEAITETGPGPATGQRRFVDRLSIRSVPMRQQTADDSDAPTSGADTKNPQAPQAAPETTVPAETGSTEQAAPAESQPVAPPTPEATTVTVRPGLRFIDRLKGLQHP
jgi:hypothetical protein